MLQMKALNPMKYNEYQPITGTQLNSAGQITITIEKQDQFLHLHNSYLLIESNVLKADNTQMLILLHRYIYFNPVLYNNTLGGQNQLAGQSYISLLIALL